MTPERWAQVREVLYAVLDLDPDQRAQYLDGISADDHVLREEVESFVLSHGQIDAGFLKTIAGDAAGTEGRPAWLGRLIGPYRIVEELGSGGMGEVYRAVRADDQYQKQVAVKIARRGFDTGSGLRRFKAERQILATLDHPHIARLLDGGSTEDGLPYVVMELVQGVPIDEYCEAHNLSLVERLQLFRLLCGAVHYAHQHLVVHCDLKPSNILVTEEGVPKLLDFGIAKLLAPENFWQPSEHTTVVRAMTPEFASPEQVRGEPITTAADVYLLGVVLYRLLTGRSPYRITSGAPHEMARVICETEPQRPSTAIGRVEGQAGPERGGRQEARRLRRRLAGDLDNIVLMALRKEPQRRYTSAAQFAEDIRRHLEALPVVARKSTLGYRAGKFAARHKLGVAATALAIVAAAAGMAVVAREARIARAQRARAEEHFQDVRALANSLLFEVHDAIQDLPGATPARQLIVQKSIEYLRHLTKDSAGDVSLERELANAYERIGLVQGNPEGSNLGDVAGALDSLTKALGMRQKLAASASGTSTGDLIQLAASYREVCGLNARYLGNIQAALDNCGKALGILEGLGGKGNRIKAELAKAYEAMGGVYGENSTVGNAGDSYAALENHRKALGLVDELADAASGDPDLHHWQARLRLVTADDLYQTGQAPQALPLYEKATLALASLARGNNTTYGHTLMRAYQRMGDMLLIGGRYTESLPYYRLQLQTGERLAVLDPRNMVVRIDLVAARATYGHALWRAGRVPEGLASLRRGLVEIGDSARTDSRAKGLESQLILWIAGAQEKAGDWSGALRNYMLARDAYDAMCRSDPRDVEDCLSVPAILDRVARIHMQHARLGEAQAEYQTALALSDSLSAGAKPNLEVLYGVVNVYYGMGEVRTAMAGARFREQACDWYRKSYAAFLRIPAWRPISPNEFEARAGHEIEARLARCK